MNAVSPVESLVTDHLDLWTAALKRKSTAGRGSSSKVELYGIKKLRELILELAVRGLLVQQDPNDEPASELLKKIASEKMRLGVKKRRLEGLGDDAFSSRTERLPRGWQWAKAASLFPTKSGNSKLIKGKLYDNPSEDRFPGYSASGQDVWLDRWEHEGTAIILSAVGARCGKAFLAKGKWSAIANTHIVWVIPTITRPEFAMLHLNNESYWIRSGGAQPFVKVGETLARDFPLPPLAEQQRIVVKVNELMAVCDQLEQQTDASLGAHQTLVETLLSALTSAADHAQFTSAWQRIASHFDTLFATEESIARLKQILLQLAVMGKLVPQDSNDEPATELLKKIAAEKAKLVKEGKIRNAKQLLPIAEDEKPFELPSGWAFCHLQELVSTLGDGLHGTPIYDNAGEYHFINGNNLSNGEIVIKPDTKRVGQTEYEKHRKELNDSTVLVSINGTIGNVAFFKGEQVILGKSACYFNLLSGIEKLFIKRFIESPFFFDYAASQATGSTISNLGLKAMNAFPIPLPPTSEQVRIIAKLDELFALCDQLKSRLSAAQTTQLHLADALVEQAIC